MYPSQDSLPTPIGTLDSLMEEGSTSSKPYKVFIGHNLGNRAFLMSIPMHDFYSMSAVANERGANGEPVAQRKLDDAHAHKLAQFVLKGLISAAIERRLLLKQPVSEPLEKMLNQMGGQPYLSLQPIVANIRSSNPRGANLPGFRMITKEEETACFKVMLSQHDILWIVDGQHRRKAMEMVFEFLKNFQSSHRYKKGGLFISESMEASKEEVSIWNECLDVARGFCTVTVEAHLGLDIDQERQLFHDLNNLGKKVEKTLALQFDNSNPINRYIKEVLIDDVLGMEPIEKDIANWQEDTGQLTLKDIVAVNAILFLNKTNISGATPADVENRKDVATAFWTAVKSIPNFGIPGAKLKTVAAQPVVLKALAKLAYNYAFNKRKSAGSTENLETLLRGIPALDFNHTNPAWRYYQFTKQERQFNGVQSLQEYLPSDDEGFNRDLGGFDPSTKVMRFSVKHNDIYPILGDIFRQALSLPSRNEKAITMDNL